MYLWSILYHYKKCIGILELRLLSVCVSVRLQVSLTGAVFRLVPRKDKPSNGHGRLVCHVTLCSITLLSCDHPL